MADGGSCERGEDLEHPCRDRRLAGSVFVVVGKLCDPGLGHRLAHLTFDQRVDEERDVQAEAVGVDATVALQCDRCRLEHALEGRVAAFEVRLAHLGVERHAG